ISSTYAPNRLPGEDNRPIAGSTMLVWQIVHQRMPGAISELQVVQVAMAVRSFPRGAPGVDLSAKMARASDNQRRPPGRPLGAQLPGGCGQARRIASAGRYEKVRRGVRHRRRAALRNRSPVVDAPQARPVAGTEMLGAYDPADRRSGRRGRWMIP